MQIRMHSKSKAKEVNPAASTMLLDFSRRDFSDEPYFSGEIDTLASNNELLTEAIDEKDAKSVLGAIDKKRDQALQAIFLEVGAKAKWHDETISAAAKRVLVELDKFGRKTINLAYGEESASINALLADFTKLDVAEAISKLPGMDILISWLRDKQDEFQEASIQSTRNSVKKGKQLSATKLCELIITHINETILVYLRGIALSKPEKYKECLDVVEKIIEINNIKVRRRLNGRDSGKDTPEE